MTEVCPARQLFVISVLLFVGITAFAATVQAQQAEPGVEVPGEKCEPPCRYGYLCYEGKCVSPCNPPCAVREVCTRSGMCVPSAETPPPVAAPSGGNWRGKTGYTQGWQQGSTGGSVYSGSGKNAYPQGQEKEEATKSDYPHGAVLTNPFAIILTPALYGFGVIPLEVQVGGDYAALDIQGTLFVGGGDVLGGAGEIGLRILPMGKGLKGFYIVPRIGGGSPMGFMGTGELGFAIFPGHFVMNFGAGCGGATEAGFIWFGNISIGFGG